MTLPAVATPSADFVDIIDRAVWLSLATFLLCFVGFGLYNFYSFNWRRLHGSHRDDLLASWQVLRPLLHALFFALVVGGGSFLVYAFVPAPFLDNFSTRQNWIRTPLRVTSMQYDRFAGGFSLKGEIWNQTKSPLPGVQVVVIVVDHNQETLAEVTTTPTPPDLAPGATATFQTRYTEKSNLIFGYRLLFRDAEGKEIPHVAGFDEE